MRLIPVNESIVNGIKEQWGGGGGGGGRKPPLSTSRPGLALQPPEREALARGGREWREGPAMNMRIWCFPRDLLC